MNTITHKIYNFSNANNSSKTLGVPSTSTDGTADEGYTVPAPEQVLRCLKSNRLRFTTRIPEINQTICDINPPDQNHHLNTFDREIYNHQNAINAQETAERHAGNAVIYHSKSTLSV